MVQEDKEAREAGRGVPLDEATLLKKRARRRLIGAVALALFAAIVLPMVMDHQPAPPLKDIQVRIPSPDEGATQKSPPAKPVAKSDIKPIAKPEPKPEQKSEAKPESKPESKPEIKAEPKAEQKPEPKPEQKTEAKAETKSDAKPEAKAATTAAEAWEVQLGAYSEAGRVKNLMAKLKELGIPAYTEKIETSSGPRTRVRAGPFSSQEAAEKAKARIKIIGVDGPVAKKS